MPFWEQVGDGTTTVVILSGEFLKEAKPFVEDGVHPRVSKALPAAPLRRCRNKCLLARMDALYCY